MQSRQDKAVAGLTSAMKNSIRAARLKAALSVNQEMITFFWGVGRDVVERQKSGDLAIIERLARDLQAREPGNICFSRENIEHMRDFYLAWPDSEELPYLLPWSHHVVLLQRLKKHEDQIWYAYQALKHGWSKETLEIQIKARIRPGPKSKARAK